MKNNIVILLLVSFAQSLFSQYSDNDYKLIDKSFSEVMDICQKDGGQLWGISLDLPFMIIDNNTKEIIANKIDANGLLKKQGKWFVGKLPSDRPVGSSFGEFGGTIYAHVEHPFGFEDSYLNVQIIHELFHAIQDSLGFNFSALINTFHLDDVNGRILLQLEWAALEKALTSKDLNSKKKHINYALKFRTKRRLLFQNAAENENTAELHEGLPEYTGYILTHNRFSDYVNAISMTGEPIKSSPSFQRSFAYYSGCLYGGLLYSYNKDFGKALKKTDDLGELLRFYSGVGVVDTIFDDYFVNKNYNAETIRTAEHLKWENRLELVNQYKSAFSKDTLLILDVINSGCKAFPTALVLQLDTLNTFVQKVEFYAVWGKLIVNDGCSINYPIIKILTKGMKVNGNIISTDSWQITLNDNWYMIFEDGHYCLKNK
jgi:hypothetical protein